MDDYWVVDTLYVASKCIQLVVKLYCNMAPKNTICLFLKTGYVFKWSLIIPLFSNWILLYESRGCSKACIISFKFDYFLSFSDFRVPTIIRIIMDAY